MCKCGRAAFDPIHDNPETYRPFAHAVEVAKETRD